jgi:hypothetical protein
VTVERGYAYQFAGLRREARDDEGVPSLWNA